MATRSAIGIQKADGSIQGVYCHWDGYPEHNGQILASHYDREKLLQLIALGNLSTLSKEIGHEQDFDKRSTQKDDWCLFYGRDRGETGQGPKTFKTVGDFVDHYEASWAEHFYWLDLDGNWWHSSVSGGWQNGSEKEFTPLEYVIAKEVA
jgi:hypothetical protein|tara:strand:- start:2511 stop:2960 length:450 start_codon:yes stop_codon:yes gene_type:complete